MEGFISSGRIADVILVGIAIELLVVGFYLWRKGEGLMLVSLAASSLAGGAIVLALRAALQGSGWLFVAVYLGAALLAHMADLALRLLLTRQAEGPASHDS